MLFNSYGFIFLFLPAVLLGTFALGRLGHLAAVIWLALASLAFYAFGNWQFVPLLLASIAFNYAIGYLLIERKLQPSARRAALIAGVGGDLLILGIFKYAGFFAANLECDVRNEPHGQHPAAGRHLLLHFHPDRVPGRRLSRQCRALRVAALRAVRHLFPASDRRVRSCITAT